MKLNVPIVKQPEGSVDCAIAGIAMWFKFYGLKKTFAEIKKEIEVDEIGTYMPQIGTYLIRHGFKVELITMHPKLFTLKDRSCSQEKLKTIFDEAYTNAKNEQDKKVISYFKEFLKAGGKINVKIPSIGDVIKELDNGRPVGASLTSTFLTGTKPRFNFHFNLITGYDNKYIYVNDPRWDEFGGDKKYLIEDFFYGIHASAYGDLDNASLILVKKQN